MAIDFKDSIAVPSISINGASLGTLAFSSATIPTDNNQLSNGAGYVTSSGNTTIGINQSNTLNTSTVFATLNFTDGVATSATTRTLTLGNLGFTGASNANYITNNNQLANGSLYTTNKGTVTGVTATLPLKSAGIAGVIPNISIPPATGSIDGYLTRVDWTTFNNKTSNTGTITNVIAGTGITGGGTSGAVTVNTSILSVFSMLTCSTTTITTNTDGVANAVVMKFDTEAITYGPVNTIRVYGSGGISGVENSQYILQIAKSASDRFFEFQWNVTSNTNTVNNRILSGVRLQSGVFSSETLISFNTLDPTHCYIYDRGNGNVRKGTTAGSIIISVPASDSDSYYRMQFWRESASNSGVKSESVLNGTQWTIKQLL